jgi:hypothetical protein
LPLLRTKKEVFVWLKEGRKTIDIRKGTPHYGDIAHFLSGPYKLQLKITKKESGMLTDLVRSDNFTCVIPSAQTLTEALNYLRGLYGGDVDGVFTAYYVEPLS